MHMSVKCKMVRDTGISLPKNQSYLPCHTSSLFKQHSKIWALQMSPGNGKLDFQLQKVSYFNLNSHNLLTGSKKAQQHCVALHHIMWFNWNQTLLLGRQMKRWRGLGVGRLVGWGSKFEVAQNGLKHIWFWNFWHPTKFWKLEIFWNQPTGWANRHHSDQ